jgi:poly(3-hydroxybutyrate) depolymerase
VRRLYRVDKRRVYVAGMSSGGALAAHSGAGPISSPACSSTRVACGGAVRIPAIGVIQRGPETDVEAIAAAARNRFVGGAAACDPRRGRQRRRDDEPTPGAPYLRLAGHRPSDADAAGNLASAADAEHHAMTGRRSDDPRMAARWRARRQYVSIGHWGTRGAAATMRCHQRCAGPDATELVADFARDALA